MFKLTVCLSVECIPKPLTVWQGPSRSGKRKRERGGERKGKKKEISKWRNASIWAIRFPGGFRPSFRPRRVRPSVQSKAGRSPRLGPSDAAAASIE